MTSERPPRALALVDGEHYADVVRDALAALPYAVAGAVMLGGTEKVRGGEDYGVPLHASLEDGLAAVRPDVVVDLSDEPVVGARERLRLGSRSLAAGAAYVGADFRFDPVRFAPFALPSLAVLGSGKRVGKTAVAGHIARLFAGERDVVVVAMGRGGPPDPVVVDVPPTLEALLELSRSGLHAASDYLEDAALARVTTVGCRRCGGGLAGSPFVSNVEEGSRIAAALAPDLVVFEGSGAALPPVETDARVLVVGGAQDPELVAGYLGAYRLLLADLVVLTSCEEPLADPPRVGTLRAAIADVAPHVPVVETVFRPRPVEPLDGRRVAYFTTAPEAVHEGLASHLERTHGAEVALVSGNLAHRDALRSDLEAARGVDVALVEIKAAAIDVVAEHAADRGIDVVFADNEIVPTGDDLDARLRALVSTEVAA